jgi:hypothetical protein
MKGYQRQEKEHIEKCKELKIFYYITTKKYMQISRKDMQIFATFKGGY